MTPPELLKTAAAQARHEEGICKDTAAHLLALASELYSVIKNSHKCAGCEGSLAKGFWPGQQHGVWNVAVCLECDGD